MAQGATDAEVAAGALQADCVHVLHRFMEPVPCSLMVSMAQRGVKGGKGPVCMCCTILRSLSAGIGGVVHSAKRSNAYSDKRSNAYSDKRSDACPDKRCNAYSDKRSYAYSDKRSNAYSDKRSNAYPVRVAINTPTYQSAFVFMGTLVG